MSDVQMATCLRCGAERPINQFCACITADEIAAHHRRVSPPARLTVVGSVPDDAPPPQSAGVSDQWATYGALAVIVAIGLLLWGFFVSQWVQMAVVVVGTVATIVPLVWLAYHGIRDALLRWGKPVDDPYRDWEAW